MHTAILTRGRMLLAGLVLLAITALSIISANAHAAAAATNRASPKAVIYPDGVEMAVRPDLVAYSSAGDGPLLAGRAKKLGRHGPDIHWTSWSRTHATGSAGLWYDKCVPNCAADPYSRIANVVMNYSRPERLGGHLIFTLMKLSHITTLAGSPESAHRIAEWSTMHVRWNARYRVYIW